LNFQSSDGRLFDPLDRKRIQQGHSPSFINTIFVQNHFNPLLRGYSLGATLAREFPFAIDGMSRRERCAGAIVMNSTRASTPGFAGVLVLVSAITSAAGSTAQAQWTCISLHPSGEVSSQANGGSGGQQIGSVQVGPTVGHYRASLWNGSAGAWVNLHPPGTVYSLGYGAEGNHQVGEVYTDGLPRAALWTGTAASWVNLHPPGPSNSSALAIGGNQQVGRTYAGGYNAALWSGSAASYVNLNPPPNPSTGYAHSSEAFGVNGGQQVGYVIADGGIRSASLWSGSAASWVNLHPPGSNSSIALGIGGGQQVGRISPSPSSPDHASLWRGSAASWVDLHPANSTNSTASAAAGGMQVGYADVGGRRRASLWTGTAASWVDLSAFRPAGIGTCQANAIWIAGGVTYVAGRGFNSIEFRDEALLWSQKAPCKGDLNGDGFVDDSDFLFFVVAYNVLDCTDPAMPAGCPSDLNGDSFVDDADFSVFVVAYNALICP